MPRCNHQEVRRLAESTLRELFAKAGYIRRRSIDKLAAMGTHQYRKGAEVRLVVRSDRELARTRKMLALVGLRAGKPYRLHARMVQPLYGTRAVQWFGEG